MEYVTMMHYIYIYIVTYTLTTPSLVLRHQPSLSPRHSSTIMGFHNNAPLLLTALPLLRYHVTPASRILVRLFGTLETEEIPHWYGITA